MSVLIPKGHTVVVCKNERQRDITGGEATVTLLQNPDTKTFVLTIEDHVNETFKATPVLNVRELEVMRTVIEDLMWKAKIK